MTKYYPIMLNITDKTCIIIGGGNVAYRKIVSLLEYNARIIVISSNIDQKIKKLNDENKLEWISRDYKTGDIDNACLLFAATNNKQANQEIYEEAWLKNIPVNIVDAPDLCNFMIPSKIERGDLTITVSTGGKSPLLAKKIRQELEKKFDNSYADFLNLMGELRRISIAEITDKNKREDLYKEIVYSNCLERLKNGEINQVKEEVYKIFERYKG